MDGGDGATVGAPRRRSMSDEGRRKARRSSQDAARGGRMGFYLSATLVVASLVFGGRASGTPISEALLQILALWLLIRMALQPRTAADSSVSKAAIYLIWAIVGLSFLQMIPVPYGLWASTSGAPVADTILNRLGEAGGMRSLSLDSSATREAMMTLLPPIAIFFAMLEMNAADRQRLALLAVVAAAASLALGLLQFASQTGSLYLYKTTHEGFSTGFFSNRNHHADLTLIGALLVSAFYRNRMDRTPGPKLALMLMMSVTLIFILVNLVATASRAGMALSIPVLVTCAILILGFRKAGKSLLVAGVAVAIIAGGLMLANPQVFTAALGRFDADSDLRFEIWPPIMGLIGDYLPLGSGLGTFVPVYQTVEQLDSVSDRFVNHAHNDYFEIALEMGVPGILLILLFFGLFLWAASRALRRSWPSGYRSFVVPAVGGVAVLLAHSLVDYPLRTTGLATVFALLMGMLMSAPSIDAAGRTEEEKDKARA